MKVKILLAISLLAVLALVMPANAAQTPQLPLAPAAIPQFVNPLPLLSVAGGPIQTVAGNTQLTIRMCEFKARVLPSTFVPPVGSTYAGYTWVWGYLNDPTGTSTCAELVNRYDVPDGSGILDTYLGPVILNTRGSPTEITWVNDLGNAASTNVLAYKYSTDQTLHWADPLNNEENMCNHMAMAPAFGDPCAENYLGPIPAVVHLHGGEVPPELDGGPDAWFTSDGNYRGHGYYTAGVKGEVSSLPVLPDTAYPAESIVRNAEDSEWYQVNSVGDAWVEFTSNKAVYAYPNTQEATPAWFHDHVLGATRLNVYAGLAGGYLISDPDLVLPTGLEAYGLNNGGFEPTVPLIIQDRKFDTNGQLFFPADTAGGLLWSPNPEHPYWVPEFEGDVIVVNGKAWPKFDVQQKRYRFLFLNGSNARTYEMFLVDPITGAAGPNMWVIATDGGYLDKPVLAKKLTMMPGERYEVIIDFAGFANPNGWMLKNTAKTPFPAGVAPQGATTAKIMLFSVTGGPIANNSFNPADPTATIRTGASGSPKIVRMPGVPGGPVVVTAAGAAQNIQKIRQLTLNEVMGMPQPNVIDPVTGLPANYPGGPLEILVNNTKWGGERIKGVTGGHFDFEPIPGFTGVTLNGDTTYYSELPREGDTEIWEIVNITADAHPIHLHLVQFQLISRQAFNATSYNAAYNAAFPGGGWDPMMGAACAPGVYCPGFGPPLAYDPSVASGGKYGGNPDVAALSKSGKPLYLQGKPMPPNPNEAGWKDTIIVYPGQVTRIAVRWAPTNLTVQTTPNLGSLFFPFDPSGGFRMDGDGKVLSAGHGFVWHCHIIDHEDNEMMRPDLVQQNPAFIGPLPPSRTVIKGMDY